MSVRYSQLSGAVPTLSITLPLSGCRPDARRRFEERSGKSNVCGAAVYKVCGAKN